MGLCCSEGLNLLTAAAIFSQIIIAIQALGSIRKLAIEWQEPAKSMVELTKLLTFDLDIIKFSCFLGTDNPTVHFVSQMMACPVGCVLLLVSWLGTKMCGRQCPLDSVLP